MYRFHQIFKRDFLNLLLNPMWVIYGTVFPFLLVLILGFLAQGSYGSTVTAYDFYGITIIIYIALNTSTIAANSFMEEGIKNGNMRLIYSPVPAGCIYLSKILATFLFSSLSHLATITALHFTLGVDYGGGDCLYVLALLLSLELFSSILGVMFCCIFKSENTTNQILSIVVNLFAIFGGLFFQMDGLGKVVSGISCLSPAKWVVLGMFHIIYDGDLSYLIPSVAILLALSALSLLLCRKFFATEDYI